MASASVRRYAEWRGVDEADVVDLAGPPRMRGRLPRCQRTAGCCLGPGHREECQVPGETPF